MAVRSNAATLVAGIVMYAILGHSMASKSRLRASKQMAEDAAYSNQILQEVGEAQAGDAAEEALPKAGDLVSHVKKELASDHRTLGKVSKTLMAVQTDVDKTEQSMLGKVLDLQTARSFFTRHEEIDTANEKLKEDVSNLNTQVEDLSSTLYKVQKEFLANGAKNIKSEGAVKAEDIENKALIQSINAELAKESDVQEELKKLTKIHGDLMAEAVEALKAGRKSVDMLKEARAASRQEVGKHRSLRHQLVGMNNYSVACHAKVEKASKKLGRALLKDSKDSQASVMTMKQKQKSNTASQQRLLAEQALLVSEVKKYENDETEGVARLKDLREDMQMLEKRILQEVRGVEDKLREEKERVKSLRTALMENAQAEEQDISKKEVVDAHITDLTKQVHDDENPVIIATTEGQNDALRAELTSAYALFKQVTNAETAAVLKRDAANIDLQAEKTALATVEKNLMTAEVEGRKSLKQAVDKANASKAKSELIIQKAQASIAGRCKPKWDAIRKKKFTKLNKCKVWKKDLVTENAKKELLMQTAKAQMAP